MLVRDTTSGAPVVTEHRERLLVEEGVLRSPFIPGASCVFLSCSVIPGQRCARRGGRSAGCCGGRGGDGRGAGRGPRGPDGGGAGGWWSGGRGGRATGGRGWRAGRRRSAAASSCCSARWSRLPRRSPAGTAGSRRGGT